MVRHSREAEIQSGFRLALRLAGMTTVPAAISLRPQYISRDAPIKTPEIEAVTTEITIITIAETTM